ncbi:MAG: excinuclease ABC subunit UvrA, partial [Myxococcota bacterium]
MRDVDLDLPTDALVVCCGVSGSGKSSLAFDTLHAEGQRRYLEALARGMPNALPPKVDRITGLPPTIALSQRDSGRPGRSTVGSTAQIAPVLRVLFARGGTQHCPVCGRTITPRTHDEIVAALLALPEGTRLTLESPVKGGSDAAVIEDRDRVVVVKEKSEAVAPAATQTLTVVDPGL